MGSRGECECRSLTLDISRCVEIEDTSNTDWSVFGHEVLVRLATWCLHTSIFITRFHMCQCKEMKTAIASMYYLKNQGLWLRCLQALWRSITTTTKSTPREEKIPTQPSTKSIVSQFPQEQSHTPGTRNPFQKSLPTADFRWHLINNIQYTYQRGLYNP